MKCPGIYHLAKFIERPNRFLAIVRLIDSGKTVEAHVPDPGRLKELFLPNAQLVLREATNPKRKTRYSVIGVKTGQVWVNIDSMISNRLFQEEYTKLHVFRNYEIIKPEFTVGKSRFDFLMFDPETKEETLVEIKSATLVKNNIAFFPDAPTLRGKKHVNELIDAISTGYQAFIVFIIKRSDAESFAPNWKTDPHFSEALSKAVWKGVNICAVKCEYDPFERKELSILNEVPITRLKS